jgi:hypothetical protein
MKHQSTEYLTVYAEDLPELVREELEEVFRLGKGEEFYLTITYDVTIEHYPQTHDDPEEDNDERVVTKVELTPHSAEGDGTTYHVDAFSYTFNDFLSEKIYAIEPEDIISDYDPDDDYEDDDPGDDYWPEEEGDED